ncbi:hypothetical protein RRG08_036027 [Elysia crispata]|uniref:Uncharacterized protein n=1 Tax=Elysia crispata TaxID=231223 RepID=A0AAE1E0G5_9GAST|nr:hypothetical protein RRG08_036027 [Elysia crispata]
MVGSFTCSSVSSVKQRAVTQSAEPCQQPQPVLLVRQRRRHLILTHPATTDTRTGSPADVAINSAHASCSPSLPRRDPTTGKQQTTDQQGDEGEEENALYSRDSS